MFKNKKIGYENDFCFISYLIEQIQQSQWRLTKKQAYINNDFEEAIKLIREIGDTPCALNTLDMVASKKSNHLINQTVMTLDVIKNPCENCKFKECDLDDRLRQAIKLSRDGFAKLDYNVNIIAFLERIICKFMPTLLENVGRIYPEYVPFLRKHYEAPKLFCQSIQTEIGLVDMNEFLYKFPNKDIFALYKALVECQRKLLFPKETQFDDKNFAFYPNSEEDLRFISNQVSSLAIQFSLHVSNLENQFEIKTITQQNESFSKLISQVLTLPKEQPSIEYGVSLYKLAEKYYYHKAFDIIGSLDSKIKSLYAKLLRYAEKQKIPHIGNGIKKTKLFSVVDGTKILHEVLRQDELTKDDAKVIAISAQQKLNIVEHSSLQGSLIIKPTLQ